MALDDLGQPGLVSTVFLGIDHQWEAGGEPLLYETMIFGGTMDGVVCRYGTRAEAVEGHAAAVEAVKAIGELARDSV